MRNSYLFRCHRAGRLKSVSTGSRSFDWRHSHRVIFDGHRRWAVLPTIQPYTYTRIHVYISWSFLKRDGDRRTRLSGDGIERRNDCNIPLVIAPVGRTVETSFAPTSRRFVFPPRFYLRACRISSARVASRRAAMPCATRRVASRRVASRRVASRRPKCHSRRGFVFSLSSASQSLSDGDPIPIPHHLHHPSDREPRAVLDAIHRGSKSIRAIKCWQCI